MNTGYITQQQLIEAKILFDSLQINSKRLKNLLDDYKNSPQYKNALAGSKYFNGEHDIMNRQKYYWVDGNKLPDTTRSNYKIEHRFFKILVEQKSEYLLGIPLTINYNEEQNREKIMDVVNEIIGNKFNFRIIDFVKQASNNGVAYLHPYINSSGNFNYIVIPATEVIPIYDTDYQDELVAVIRFYPLSLVDENDNYKTQTVYQLEYWDATQVIYYKQLKEGGEFVEDFEANQNTGHFSLVNETLGTIEQRGWGKVPFIPLFNNSDKTTDLEDIKSLIDAYDIVKSDWMNDLQDLQEIIMVLKGYNGFAFNNQGNALTTFLKNLKENKIITVDENGGVDSLRSEIPIEAKEKFLRMLREEIFYFGKGIDITDEKFGSNPSGVSLKFLYSMLDMKANQIMNRLANALGEFMEFVSIYAKIKFGVDINSSRFSFVSNKTMLFNESEKIKNVLDSLPILSERTLLANHPFVEDVDKELENKANERESEINSNLKLFNMNNG